MNHLSISGLLVSADFMINKYYLTITCAVLDPRISYTALKDEFADDLDLADHLEDAKTKLQTYFKQHYPQANSSLSATGPSLSSVPSTSTSSIMNSSGSPQKNFTARFQRKRTSPDELLEFWSLPQEDFETIDPLKWWLGRRAQFPQLYCLARDIFSIPGMFKLL